MALRAAFPRIDTEEAAESMCKLTDDLLKRVGLTFEEALDEACIEPRAGDSLNIKEACDLIDYLARKQ